MPGYVHLQASDHDPANAIFIYNCINYNVCNVCNFDADLLFSIYHNSCNVCNLMQAYCFRFYFLLFTVIIIGGMYSYPFAAVFYCFPTLLRQLIRVGVLHVNGEVDH